jgi:hypothetical protein
MRNLSTMQYVGKKLDLIEEELNSRFGKKWFTLHMGMPGHVDNDPDRVSLWVDDDLIVRKVTWG